MISHVEVLPYAKAPWAPVLGGVRLTWAWRVTHNNGQVLIGACGGKRADAEKRAHNAAQRMERFYAGAKTYRTQVLCRPKEEKSDG